MSQFTALRPLVLMSLCLAIASCAHRGTDDQSVGTLPSPAPKPAPHAKVGNPYVIEGVRYVPREDPYYNEVGVASWYGQQFHNKLTANGELFDMNRLTAAHKTLPLPSLVRVTNLENGRTAVLRLNDRGPFAGDRIIDLSRRAAEVLGTKEQGLAQVRVEYLGPADLDDAITALNQPEDYAALELPGQLPPSFVAAAASPTPVIPQPITPIVTVPAAPPAGVYAAAPVKPIMEPIKVTYTKIEDLIPPTPRASEIAGYYVQVGAFRSADNARAARDILPMALPVRVDSDLANGAPTLHHVRIGPYTHAFAAQEAKKVAANKGFTDAHIVRRAGTE